MTTILAIDTATNACSATLMRDGEQVAGRFEPMQRGHAERLMPMLADVMSAAGGTVADVDLIAVTTGPGAFTGLRIGLATARGLALALDVPCLGVLTTEVLAAAVDEPLDAIAIAVDSKRSDLYVQFFTPDREPFADPLALSMDGVLEEARRHLAPPARLCVAGDGAARALGVLADAGFQCTDSGIEYPDAAHLARLAHTRWRPGTRPAAPTPVYLRPADATVPVNGGRLRP